MQVYHKQLLQAAANEGLGSQYERVVLAELLPTLIKPLKVKRILEYPATITKGWDNAAFGDRCNITVANAPILQSVQQWPFSNSKKPRFVKLQRRDITQYYHSKKRRFDLVWNFALFHQIEHLYQDLEVLTNRYALIFTPNVFNWGAPLHWALHLATLTRCQHPEHGPLSLMTKWGLARFFEQQGWRVIKAGFVDMPPWPDFAFSKHELAPHWPFSLLLKANDTEQENGVTKTKNMSKKIDKQPKTQNTLSTTELKNLAATIKSSAKWERAGVPSWLQPIIAHHQYVLVEKQII